MVQQSSLDDDFTHTVLKDINQGWRETFEAAEDYQARNPEIRAAALASPSDHVDGGRAIIPALATMHPLVIRRCLAYLDFIDSELDTHEPVTPPPHTVERVFVSVEGGRMRDMGGQQPHDRLAELETQVEDLQAENESLRQQLDHAIRLQEADRTSMQAAVTVLRMRLEGIG